LAEIMLSLLLACGWLVQAPSVAAIDISDIPISARIVPPPANIMLVLDDSGSMNFDILVREGYDGSFPNPANSPGQHGFCYIFDDLGDNVYKPYSLPSWYAGSEGRKYWKSQWHAVNVMYYNPNVTYMPWPNYGSTTFTNADKDKPLSHPAINNGCRIDLDGTSFTIDGVNVPHSHYFCRSSLAEKTYLVVLDRGSSCIKHYAAVVTGSGLAEKVSALHLDHSPPADVITGRSYEAERQNFANWFSYHRRREFIAKNAIANIILTLADVRVGIYGINRQIVAPLEPIKVAQGASIVDRTPALLDKLYPYQSEGGTPLKEGLDTVGRYYKENTGTLGGASGPKPYGDLGAGAACQQSFTVIITDGYYSDLSYKPLAIGNADGDNGEPYADKFSGSLADIAMYYFENDLNSLPDLVPASRFDRATHQHMATYAVAFGVSGSLNPLDFDASLHHKSTGKMVSWPEVFNDRSPQTIDDLWHATVNGRGKFLSANNPQELAAVLNDLMEAISEILLGSASPVAVNGDSLYGKIKKNTVLYQTSYGNRDNEWSGDVRAFRLDTVTGDVISSPLKWSASQRLEAREWDQRLIATFNGTRGIPFVEGSLTDGQRSSLGTDPANKVKYIRGGNVSGYRPRSQKLGDIVNSAPVFEDGVVYCGANDGMLHAFDAETGEELFAYLPNLVFANLTLLSDPGYSHKFYVDLTPSIKSGGGILGGIALKTLLVGGLRKGGKGYFALDITGAKSISSETDLAGRALWEFPKTADPDMGYSFSKPVAVKSNSSAYPWIVIFGNGYNSDSGKSVLYIVSPSTGELIKKIVADPGPGSGLSTPVAIDVTYDGLVDFIYAGDLHGKLWKFDLSSKNSELWQVAYSRDTVSQPLFQAKGPAGAPQPITARPDVMHHPDKDGLIVCFGTGKYLGESDLNDDSVQSIYGIWDYGDRVYTVKGKKWSDDDNKEYLGAFNRDSSPQLDNQPARVKLLQQKQKVYTVRSEGVDYRLRLLDSSKPVWKTTPDSDNANRQKPDPSAAIDNDVGYYFDLNTGERVISDVMIRGGNLLAIGFTPSTDPCGPGGNSIFMELNAFTGGTAGSSLFDITGDRQVNEKDLVRIDLDGDGTREDLAPSGIELPGNLQPPVILGIGSNEDNSLEKKYLSSSTGRIEQLTEKGTKLGVMYWMQIHH
jgi:type IV pilus assembly protein PilY1